MKLLPAAASRQLAWCLGLLCAGVVQAFAGLTPLAADQKSRKVPVIYCTDLFHPHDDPDDHFDLATLYAIEELDVRAIILDQGEKQLQKPGRIPVAQMNQIAGRKVPAAIGLAQKLKSPSDKGLEQPEDFQAGVRLILETLRASDRPVAIAAVGSMRDLAAAYNREPALLRAKVGKLLIFIGEASDPKFKEYNVNLDPQAYIALMRSGLPVYWVPCFDGGMWQNRGHASFWRARHEELLRDASPALIQYFIYALEKEKGDPTAFLAAPVDPRRKARLFAGVRNLWCTAIFGALADKPAASPLFGFSEVEITISDDAVVHEGHAPNSTRVKRFEILDPARYAAGMTSATARLLRETGNRSKEPVR